MDGAAHASICSATANGVRHGGVNFRVGGMRLFMEQRSGGHDHAGLAIAALRNVFLNPSALTRMFRRGPEAFNRSEVLVVRLGDWNLAGTDSSAEVMHGASAANAYAAAVFCAGQLKKIAQHPEKRHVGRGDDLVVCAVDGYGKNRHLVLQAAIES
jgi:hypothetical protein